MEHHRQIWLGLGACLIAVTLALLAVAAIGAYVAAFLAVICFVAAVRDWPFPGARHRDSAPTAIASAMSPRLGTGEDVDGGRALQRPPLLAYSPGPPPKTVIEALVRRGERLLVNARRLSEPSDRRRARFAPHEHMHASFQLGARYVMDGPKDVNTWLADTEEFVEAYRPELVARLFRKALGGTDLATEIAAIENGLAVLREVAQTPV